MSHRSQKKRKTSYNSFAHVASPLHPKGPRSFTTSLAIPASILASLPTSEQKLHLAARISRCLAIFSIDEVVVFTDSPAPTAINHASYTGDSDHAHFLTHLLSFLECPPFMRKNLFPIHPNLRHTAQLPSLDTPHHPNPKDPWIPYREGVTLPSPSPNFPGTVVDAGLDDRVVVPDDIPPNTRVTLRFTDPDATNAECVHPDTPKVEGGYYWGYAVRKASSLSGVFTECPFPEGYDVSIGASERGEQTLPLLNKRFQHMLIVLGGPRGLEYAATNDEKLASMGIRAGKTAELFDHYLNVVPNQGTRAISTDEALPIALTTLKPLWEGTT